MLNVSRTEPTTRFVLHQPVDFEESLTCEFKEVMSQPVQAIGKVVDEYVVAFLNEAGGSIYWGIRDSDRVVTGIQVSDKTRDQLKQVIGQKVATIAPPVPGELIRALFHEVCASDGSAVPNACVFEVQVGKPPVPGLFLTGGGEAYRRTIGGTKKLSGAELFMALESQLQARMQKPAGESLLARLPALYRRAMLVESLIRGRRVLWVDDQPSNNFYERVALAQIGVSVDVVVSSDEGIRSAKYLPPDRADAHILFELISKRYEKGAIILTSNKSYTEWGELLADHVLAAAILDRLLHHSNTINIKGDSYRLKEKKRAGFNQPVAPTSPTAQQTT